MFPKTKSGSSFQGSESAVNAGNFKGKVKHLSRWRRRMVNKSANKEPQQQKAASPQVVAARLPQR
jgi:hypothetical protein